MMFCVHQTLKALKHDGLMVQGHFAIYEYIKDPIQRMNEWLQESCSTMPKKKTYCQRYIIIFLYI